MARDGAGTYSLPVNSFNPAVAATDISPSDWNSTGSDLAAALTASIAKDGQTVPTANLPMGGFKITGLGAASAAGEALSQATAVVWTPVLKFGGASVGVAYTTQTAKYVLRGNVIDYWMTILLSSAGSSVGSATITGLPTNAAATAIGATFGDAIALSGQLQAKILTGGSTIFLYALGGGTAGPLQNTNFTATSEINVSGSYLI